MKPVRIQRKRTKGYNMQEESKAVNGLECKYVGRPTMWGNPYTVYDCGKVDHEGSCNMYDAMINDINAFNAENVFEDEAHWLTERIQQNLSGLNLSCFCPLDKPCHADILLEIANE